MKITLIKLDLWCSTVTHQSALTPILDFFLSSEVVIMWQTDGIAYKLKPRSFHKFAHLWVHSTDFHPSVNYIWQYHLLWNALNTDNFYFILFYFSDFISILLFFSFLFNSGQWRGTWHCSHMTYHMMWCYRPRTW